MARLYILKGTMKFTIPVGRWLDAGALRRFPRVTSRTAESLGIAAINVEKKIAPAAPVR